MDVVSASRRAFAVSRVLLGRAERDPSESSRRSVIGEPTRSFTSSCFAVTYFSSGLFVDTLRAPHAPRSCARTFRVEIEPGPEIWTGVGSAVSSRASSMSDEAPARASQRSFGGRRLVNYGGVAKATFTSADGSGGVKRLNKDSAPASAGTQSGGQAPKKVQLGAGYSQMDWMRLTKREPDLAGLRGASRKRKISAEEVATHNTAEDCWTVLRGKVYNLSERAVGAMLAESWRPGEGQMCHPQGGAGLSGTTRLDHILVHPIRAFRASSSTRGPSGHATIVAHSAFQT